MLDILPRLTDKCSWPTTSAIFVEFISFVHFYFLEFKHLGDSLQVCKHSEFANLAVVDGLFNVWVSSG